MVAPPAPPHHVTHLDVSDNSISALSPDVFSNAPALADLNLSGNPLGAAIPSDSPGQVQSAWSAGAMSARGLLRLRAARCQLRRVPHDLTHPTLQYIDFSENELDELHPLPALPSLHTLDLRKNRLLHVDERAFHNAPNIRILRLDENFLSHLPHALSHLRHLEELSASRNTIVRVSSGVLSACERLARVTLAHNPLSDLEPGAFDNLPRLISLVLSDASGLTVAPRLVGATRLASLRCDRARLSSLPPSLCDHAPSLRTLDVKLNQLHHFPDLSKCSELRVLDLSSNSISVLEEDALSGTERLRDLQLARNALRRLGRNVFRHTTHLRYLDLEENELEFIDGEAFLPISQLEELNVGGNRLRSLPAGGLQSLRALRAHNNPTLTRFHPPDLFPRIQTLVLSYAYHCCEFLSLMDQQAELDEGEDEGEEDNGKLTDFVLVPSQHLDLAAWANATDLYQHYLNLSSGGGVAGGVAGDTSPRGRSATRRVSCVPLPGPFLPCSDLFEWWALRCGVWAVFLLALLGNGTVVVVLGSSRSRLDVPRFLVANLAAADFFMGLYLAVLAVVDAGTLGEFRERAVRWQLSGACRAAGFLAVLSSELSVYTLAVITLERNYAITHAMHLNKRLSLRHAAAVMAAGWTFALVAAALPLLGVSDYRKFAVCLPFETSTPVALGYVTTVLAVNGLAFLVLLGCYLKMYCAIRGSQAWNSNDSRIAKRMALLVFTDFLCWSPIAFFALTAAFGLELVSLEEAKVFTVFVLPLNSCCNPFLYAILTKQFKKDCALVCKAIEESRVTRGIGRCRHSSNFSNRQTPANTSSLVERSSRAHAASCACRRLLHEERAAPHGERLLRWLRACSAAPAPPPPPAPPPRAGSVSSSVEFSSSRSDSWRRPPPPPRRAASWLVARKTSQDSNLSSSRNDSSGSNATASTGTWRTSRSAGAGTVSASGVSVTRPRLTRQPNVTPDEPPEPRPLTTIPSAAETDPPPPPPPPPEPGPNTASL